MWVSLCFFRFLLPFNSNEQISHLIFRLSPNSCCSRRCTNKLAFLLKTYNKIFPKLIPILLLTLVHAVTFHEKNSLSLLKKKTLSQNLKLPSHICHRGILSNCVWPLYGLLNWPCDCNLFHIVGMEMVFCYVSPAYVF